MTDQRCPIWGTPAEIEPRTGDYLRVVSARAGGSYVLTGSAEAILKNHDDELRRRISLWIFEQNRLGKQYPEISSYRIEELETIPPLPVADRAKNAMLVLSDYAPEPGTIISFGPQSDLELANKIMSASFSLEWNSVGLILRYLFETGLLEKFSADMGGNYGIKIRMEGFSYLESLKGTNRNSMKAFVAMWFSEEMEEAWENGIEAAIRESGYDPKRIDRKEFLGSIPDEIIAEIRQSRFVVADFTHGEKGQRGGVYYEAGFAHGLGIPVIMTAHQDMFDDKDAIHFDTKHLNHIAWDNPKDLKVKLVNRIKATID